MARCLPLISFFPVAVEFSKMCVVNVMECLGVQLSQPYFATGAFIGHIFVEIGML